MGVTNHLLTGMILQVAPFDDGNFRYPCEISEFEMVQNHPGGKDPKVSWVGHERGNTSEHRQLIRLALRLVLAKVWQHHTQNAAKRQAGLLDLERKSPKKNVANKGYHKNLHPSFLEVISPIFLGPKNLQFSRFWGPKVGPPGHLKM